jgi:hypothetical protein
MAAQYKPKEPAAAAVALYRPTVQMNKYNNPSFATMQNQFVHLKMAI